MGWKSIATGALGLAALDLVVTAPAAQQGQLRGLLAWPAKVARAFIAPTPLIGQQYGTAAGTAGSSSGGSGSQSSTSTGGGSTQPVAHPLAGTTAT